VSNLTARYPTEHLFEMIVTMLVLALALSNPVAATQTSGHVDVNRAFNYVVVLVMENHGLRDVISTSSAPFMNQLAASYSLAVNYTAIDHPSLPNYLGLISGQDFSSWSSSDCSPRPGCSAGSAPNLVDSLEDRGLTWKSYMEDYPSTCGSHCSPADCFTGDGGTGLYAARHDPFVYFDDIVNSTARCSRIVPANSGVSGSPDDLFLSDLSSPSTASNFMWLTPNSCNDTHGFTYQNGTVRCTDSISIGDNYLSQLVPKILASKLFTHQKAALFITFDEGNTRYPYDYVYSVWAGRVVKSDFVSSNHYSHYSLLSTLETVWHLKPLTSNDANAPAMTEFFVAHNHGQNGHPELRDERNEPRKADILTNDHDQWSSDDFR